MWRLVMCFLTSCAIPGSVLAQGGRPQLQEGDRIRVSAEAASGVFVVLGLSGDTMTLQEPSLAGAIHLPLNSIRKLEVSRGARSAGRGALRGAGIGLGIGAGTGAIAGLASGDDEGIVSYSAEEKALILAVMFGGAGAIVGGIIGALSPGERWERVVIYERVGFSLTNARTLALSYRFRF